MNIFFVILGAWVFCFALSLYMTFFLDEKDRPKGLPSSLEGRKDVIEFFILSPLITIAIFIYAFDKYFSEC